MIVAIVKQTLFHYLLFNFTYYFTSFICYLFDYTEINKHSKIQTKKNSFDYYRICLRRVLLNTFGWAVLPCLALAVYNFYTPSVPFNIYQSIFHLMFAIVSTDVSMYICHRMLHLPCLYQRYHKLHHQISAPVGLSAVYMTPVDFYLGNILPITLPLLVLQTHIITLQIWLVLVTVNTIVLAHSGFKIADFHDKHHSTFIKNYGTNIFMDVLMGTKYMEQTVPKIEN